MSKFKFTVMLKIYIMSIIFVVLVSSALIYLATHIESNSVRISTQNQHLAEQKEMVKSQNIALENQNAKLNELDKINRLKGEFNSMRFWLYDLQVSLLMESEDKAESSLEEFNTILETITANGLTGEIGPKTQEFYDVMIEAVDAYSEENRVLGNSKVSSARNIGNDIDKMIFSLLEDSKKQVQDIITNIKETSNNIVEAGNKVSLAATVVQTSNNVIEKLSYSVLIAYIVLSIVFCLVLRHSINFPMQSLKNSIKQITDNYDLTVKCEKIYNDEIGEIAETINLMMDSFKELVKKSIVTSEGLTNSLKYVFSSLDKSIEKLIDQHEESTTVIGSINEMVISIQSVSEDAVFADETATNTKESAIVGKDVISESANVNKSLSNDIKQANNTVKNVSEHSSKIVNVLNVIKGISEQTNLLALNAAIEAARAGENGRGFAVVADEVRSLAKKTSDSTEEIQIIIGKLQNVVEQAVSAMEKGVNRVSSSVTKSEEAGKVLTSIIDAVSNISQINSGIASATEKQRIASEQIAKSMAAIQKIYEDTAVAAQETIKSSVAQSFRTFDLRDLTNIFKV
jgi:methyl-accepting chemotaxis protein